MSLGQGVICWAIFLRRLMVGVVIGYAAIVATRGGTADARPAFYGLAISWVVLLVVYGRQPAKESSVSRPLLRWTEILATNFALILLLAEGSLRAYGAWSGNPLVLSAALEGYRLTPGQDYGGGLFGNRLGYPGPEFQREKRPGVSRIAALGDSFAIGPAVPFADNYLTDLERSLQGVEVYNFGVSGTGPREYLAILRRDVWTYQPDRVLLSIFVGNDITETLATPRHLDPRQHALYVLCDRAWRLWRNGNLTEMPPARNRLAGPPLSEVAFREIEKRRLAVCIRPVSAGLQKKWQRALADLSEIVRDCRRHKTPLAVVLIPDEFQVNPAVLAQATADAGVPPSSVEIELPQRKLRDFFREKYVPCLDLLASFQRCVDLYAVRDTHWNRAGNRLAAEQIRDWLENDAACGFRRSEKGERKATE